MGLKPTAGNGNQRRQKPSVRIQKETGENTQIVGNESDQETWRVEALSQSEASIAWPLTNQRPGLGSKMGCDVTGGGPGRGWARMSRPKWAQMWSPLPSRSSVPRSRPPLTSKLGTVAWDPLSSQHHRPASLRHNLGDNIGFISILVRA